MTSSPIAFIFPGQGESHSVGMGKDFYDQFPLVQKLFKEASEITGVDLKSLIFEGPIEKLSTTENCQIAIYVVSIAILRVIQSEFPHLKPSFVAGLSLGEYSAATAAGLLSFEQGVRLVHARGTLMQKACYENPSTMAVVLGLTEEQMIECLSEIALPHDLWIANLNCPGQIVVSGTHKGIDQLLLKAKEKGAKRVLPLNVAGAFHSPLMKSAAILLEEKFKEMPINEPQIPLAMNATGLIETESKAIRKNLMTQITTSVKWQSCIEELQKKGVQTFYEIGPGKVLAGLNKRIKVEGQTLSINSVEDLESILAHTS